MLACSSRHASAVVNLSLARSRIDLRSLSPSSKAKAAATAAATLRRALSSGAQVRHGRFSTNHNNIRHEDLFSVTTISFQDGSTQLHDLPPKVIMRDTSILPRDLVSLNLTSLDEHTNWRHQRNHVGDGEEHLSNRKRFLRPPTAIVPRPGSLLLSFGNVRAVANTRTAYLLDAHRPG